MALSDLIAQAPSMVGVFLIALAILYMVGSWFVGTFLKKTGHPDPLPDDRGFPQL